MPVKPRTDKQRIDFLEKRNCELLQVALRDSAFGWIVLNGYQKTIGKGPTTRLAIDYAMCAVAHKKRPIKRNGAKR